MMKYVFDKKKTDNKFECKINNKSNKIKLGLINGLRRTILTQTPNFSIDNDSIDFEINTSMLHNGMLKHRLILLPIRFDTVSKLDLNDIVIKYEHENKTELMKNILLKEFEVEYKNKKMDINKIFSHTNILFSKLNKGQHIKFNCKLKQGIMLKDGASMSNVSCCTYYPTPISNKINEKIYKKHDDDTPYEYNFKLEIENDVDPIYVIKMGLKNIHTMLSELKTFDNINIIDSDVNFKAYDFIIDDPLHKYSYTIGNLLTSYMIENIKYKFVGYDVPSPLDYKLIIRTSLNKNNTKEENKLMFLKYIKHVSKLLIELIKNF